MNDQLIFERLARHGADGVEPDAAFEDRLYAVIAREVSRRTRPTPYLLVAAALLSVLALGAAVVAGGLLRVPGPDARVLDPATLSPCDVLPGPATPGMGAPLTHDGDPRIGGQACAYGWDAGSNPHFQLRPSDTTAMEADELVRRVMGEAGEIVVDDQDIRGWIGPVEAMSFRYVAVVGHQDPYLFVAFLRDISGAEDDGQPPAILERDRAKAAELVYGVLDNLEALRANESLPYAMEVTP